MEGTIKDGTNLVSLQGLKGQHLKVVGRVKTGLISQPEFLILEDESGAHHEINPEFFTPLQRSTIYRDLSEGKETKVRRSIRQFSHIKKST